MFLAPNIIILIKEGSVPKSGQNWLNTLVYITASFNQGLSLAGRGGGELRGSQSSLPFLPRVTALENWGCAAPERRMPRSRGPCSGGSARAGRIEGRGEGRAGTPGSGPPGRGRMEKDRK